MKISLFAVPIAFVAIVSLFSILPKPVPVDKEQAVLRTMIKSLNQAHFAPQELNDSFSIKVFDLYLDRIDAGRRFFTQEEVDSLHVHRLKLDDQISNADLEFFNASLIVLEVGVERAQKYFEEHINGPFDFDGKERFIVKAQKRSFPANEEAMNKHWRQMIKYNVLTKVSDKIREAEKKKDTAAQTESEKKSGRQNVDTDDEFGYDDADLNIDLAAALKKMTRQNREVLIAEARTEVEKEFINWFKRMGKSQRSDRYQIYLNAIASVYDPHTEYYEPTEKESFDINMSGRLEGIGARLQTTPDGEMTKVSEIITGGPAWKNKQLEADDIIIKVAQEGKEPEDITGFTINEVVKRIRGPKGTKVTLTVKKNATGATEVIEIVRDEVIMDEGYVKSLIIEDSENKKRIGYIRLPRFYADFDRADGRQCSIDFLNELEKLKENKVEGIIVDLRNNGGGSLRDVVKMSGYFIESGPIVQVKDRDSSPNVLDDPDRGVQYDGALIIMVNEFSASASEIMAAALQDYGRAIIVGSRTFGKGTVQRFVDLDRYNTEGAQYKPMGQVKLTIQKFYRVNGGSTQLEGVLPDIMLPDNYSYITVGEREADHPLPFTRINPKGFSQSVYKINKLSKIQEKTTKEVAQHPTFRAIEDNARRIKELRDRETVSLNLEEYIADEMRNLQFDKKYKDLMQPLATFKLANLPQDLTEISADESKKARNDEWLKDTQKDIYLYQTLRIMAAMTK